MKNGHVTSPYDIAVMSRELLVKHPSITKYTTIYMDTLRDGKSQLVNTNKLVRNYDGCTGLKTGSTSIALFNLSASATRNDLSLIAIIMKAETTKIRFSEAQKLLNYGYSNYQYKEIAKAGDVIGTCNVNKGIDGSVEAEIKDNVGFVIKKGDKNEITQEIDIFNNINAPVIKGQKIGEIVYKSGEKNLKTVDLISNKNDAKYSVGSMINSVYNKWFTLLRR